jgi:hypothetical protein
MFVVGEVALVVENAAAHHGVGAGPRREQYCFEQSVLFGVLLHSGALKAIDGRDVDVVENHLLRVPPGHGVVWLEAEDRRGSRLGLAGLGNTAHVHAVDVEGHVLQLCAAMCVVVRGIRAVGAGLHLDDLILRAIAILRVIVDLVLFRLVEIWHVHGHRLHVAENLLRLVLDDLVVEVLLTLLYGPLKLPGEDCDVVVALQAITVCEDVDGKLGR